MKTDEIEKTEKTASGDYLRMMTCYVIWGFQPLYFHLKPDIDGLFLLMSRILWGCVLVTAVVLLRGRGREILETFRDKELMLKHLIPGAFFNFLDLALYLFAVTSGHILATSLGYYVAPLVVCALGVVVFHEKLTWQLIAAAALILTGVLLSGSGFGNAPLISIGLMFCFSIYAAFMKGVKKDAVVCTAVHLMLVAPFALLTILLFRTGQNGLASVDFGTQIFLMGAGAVMSLPIVLYASCVKRVPMVVMGLLQYLSPTFGIVCSIILHEKMGRGQFITFCFIWAALLLFTVVTRCRERQEKQAETQTAAAAGSKTGAPLRK